MGSLNGDDMRDSMNRSGERGAVAVLVAIMLVLLFVCVALVVDVGHVHSTKISLQQAVDAAALAAAQELPDGIISTTANNYLQANLDEPLSNYEVTVAIGWWDKTITTGGSAATRFINCGSGSTDPRCTVPNAVMVRAMRTAGPFFAFWRSGTDVTADAIAFAETVNPVLPLAVVSCLLPGSDWKLPDMTITGITDFRFAANDTGAWTSLTFSPANANTINDLITDPDKLDQFNSVIYGYKINNNGIENTDVDAGAFPYTSSYAGCSPEGTSIDCGLGRIAGKEIAAPEEYPVPPNFANLDGNLSDGYKATAFDPLSDFGSFKDASGNRSPGALPRWYNLNEESGLQSDDYFARLLTQDGLLLNTGKLLDYSTGVETPLPLGAGDDRFRASKDIPSGGDLITCDSKGCRPNYDKVLQRAGYPQVYLTNGVTVDLINNFLEKLGVENETMLCSEDDALPATQQALVLKAPVIFVGACEDWKANASERHSYVGLAKLLVTRLWVNNTGYDCPGSDLQAENQPGPLHIEGLQILPVADGQDDHASLPKIYLVE